MEDPYLIEGWSISVVNSPVFFAPGFRAGILVENTNAFFVIRSVFVVDGPGSSANIVLKNVMNGRIESSKILNGNRGIVLRLTNGAVVTGNEVSGLGVGIDLGQSSGNLVEENLISNTGIPIEVRVSSWFNIVQDNVIEGRVGPDAVYSTISFNSSFNVFRRNLVRNGLFGIAVFEDSHFNRIVQNEFVGAEESAVHVYPGSRGTMIMGNIIIDSGRGIFLLGTIGTVILGNSISAVVKHTVPGLDRYTGRGVWLHESSWTIIAANSIKAPVGIQICDSPHTFLLRNDLAESQRKLLRGHQAC